MIDDDEIRDPLLVRRFLLSGDESGSESDGGSGVSTQTWPSATTREVRSRSALDGADDPTAVLILPAPEPRTRGSARRRLLVLGAVSAVVLLGGAAVAFAAMRPSASAPMAAAIPDPPLRAAPTSASAAAPAPSASHRATTRRAASPTGSKSGAPSPSAAAPTTSAAVTPTTTPPDTLIPDPKIGRAGEIRGPGGLCLDGGSATDDSHVEVAACSGAETQSWDLASDGTLRVSGLCALLVGDGSVHLAGCDTRTTAQWRVTGSALVNAASSGCLADPDGGARPGTTVRVAVCDGGADQRWTVS